MAKNTPVIIIRSLDLIRGGITRATFTRANALARHYKEVKIVTLYFQQSHSEIVKDIYDKGLLAKNIKVYNFFEDMKPKVKFWKVKYRKLNEVKERGFNELLDENHVDEPSYRYYKEGFYVKYKRFDKEGNLKFIDYMNENRQRTKREEFNRNGHLVRIRHMDLVNNKPMLDRYFKPDNNCFMSVWVDPKDGSENRTLLYNDTPREFNSLFDAQLDWIQSILKKIKRPVVMTEQRSSDKFLRKLKHKNIKKIAVVHANHLESPYNDNSKLKKGYAKLFNKMNKIDNIVFLTNEQKKAVEEVYGEQKSFCIIPHPCKQIDQMDNNETKIYYNPLSAVTLARYHPDKRLDEAIKAFKYVVEKIPNATYHIYGYGPEIEKLMTIIDKINLKDNVFLENYVADTSAVYKAAACTILTSAQEGFGMVITESLANGTPVVSYATKYGPRDIITEGIDGFVVAEGDKTGLRAEKVIEIMKNKDLRNKMSINAMEVKEKYSEDKFINNWIQLIEAQ